MVPHITGYQLDQLVLILQNQQVKSRLVAPLHPFHEHMVRTVVGHTGRPLLRVRLSLPNVVDQGSRI